MSIEFHPMYFSADPTNAFLDKNSIEATNVNITKDKTLRDDSLFQRQVSGLELRDAVRNQYIAEAETYENTLPHNPTNAPQRSEQRKEREEEREEEQRLKKEGFRGDFKLSCPIIRYMAIFILLFIVIRVFGTVSLRT